MDKMLPGMASRVAGSILVVFGWAAFIILYAVFYASGFTLFQNLAIIFASFLVGMALLGAMWASWGMKHGHGMCDDVMKDKDVKKAIRKSVRKAVDKRKRK